MYSLSSGGLDAHVRLCTYTLAEMEELIIDSSLSSNLSITPVREQEDNGISEKSFSTE